MGSRCFRDVGGFRGLKVFGGSGCRVSFRAEDLRILLLTQGITEAPLKLRMQVLVVSVILGAHKW